MKSMCIPSVYLWFFLSVIIFGGQQDMEEGKFLTVDFYSPSTCMTCVVDSADLGWLIKSSSHISSTYSDPRWKRGGILIISLESVIHSFIPKIWIQCPICTRLYAKAVNLTLSKIHHGSCPHEAYNLGWLMDIHWIIILKIITAT